MQTREYRTIDKSAWGPGEWQSEPDKVQWRDEATGLPCLAVRHTRAGHWCGYVGVSDGHPYYGKDYGGCTLAPTCGEEWCGHTVESMLDAHGGITFAAQCQPGEDEGRGVCHVPEPGEPDHVWWLGFDCAHSGDVSPAYERHFDHYATYRPLDFIKRECAKLAAQLVAVR
jgi:hypothetical protein